MKWKLTFMFEDTEHDSFAAAFSALKERIDSNKGVGEMIVELFWITPPNSRLPMFFEQIRARAEQEGLLPQIA